MIRNPLDRSARYRGQFPVLPGAFPLVGHGPGLYYDATRLLRHGHETLGPLFWVHVGFDIWILMCTAREGFEVFKNKAASTGHVKEDAYLLMGESLGVQDEPVHQHMRSAMNAPFSPRGLTTSGTGAQIADSLIHRVNRWAERRRIVVLDETQEATLNVIFHLIGVEVNDFAAWNEHYRDFVYAVFPLVPRWIPGSPTRRAEKARVWIDEHLRAIIHEESRRPERPSLLSALVHGRDDRGQRQSERELIDNLRVLVLAGHETTAAVMAWLVIELAQRPDLWDKLCTEARAQPGLPMSPQELRAFPFAEALFRETLRLYPAVPYTSRRLTEEIHLAGRRIPRGSVVGICINLLSRDPGLYPDPDRFDPSRWLDRKDPLSPVELASFGGGPHFCLGYHLAWLETVQFTVALARRMSQDRLRPRLVEKRPPHQYHLPVSHPPRKTQIAFV